MQAVRVLTVTLLALLLVSCKENYVQTEILQTPVTLSSEWRDIVPVNPLRCDRTDQEMLLHSQTPFTKKVDTLEMVLQDGKTVKPEAQLITDDGKEYQLDVLSFWGDEVALTGRSLPRSTNFARLRIRSQEPIKLSSIKFNCYNFADVKR